MATEADMCSSAECNVSEIQLSSSELCQEASAASTTKEYKVLAPAHDLLPGLVSKVFANAVDQVASAT